MRAAILFLCVVLFASPPAFAARGEAGFGRFHALVIGNNDYRHLPPLKTAVGDATAAAELLRDRYGYAVTLLKNATRADILRAFNRLRAELTESDNLLIYYAGHGTLDRVTETGYWLPVDAEEDSDLNWVPNEAVSRHLRGMSARHVMVIADSCYSGTLVRDANAQPRTGAERDAWLARVSEKRSRTAITSGGLEPVVDGGADGHSVFSGAFLRALAENRGILEGSALFQRISRPIVVAADQTPAYADIRKAGHEGGEFLFIPRDYAAAAASDSPAGAPAPAAATPAAPQAALEITFWQSIQASTRAEDFAAYLSQFPQGTFAGLARSRLAALQQQPAERQGRPALKTGDSFRDCADCPELVALAPGRFAMGVDPGTPEGAQDEQPRHEAMIDKPFALGRYEVTRAEFELFVQEAGAPRQPACEVWSDGQWEARAFGWQYPDFEQGPADPVVCVSWQTARAYTRWLSRKSGHDYRLPTETEWEYAARADTATPRPWGHDADAGCGFANGADAALDDSYWFERTWRVRCSDDHRRTAPAGSFTANAWGLHDMLGNAAEWTADCWRGSYDEDPPTTGCRDRALRGGHWADGPLALRITARAFHQAGTPHAGIGFRVARSLERAVAVAETTLAGPAPKHPGHAARLSPPTAPYPVLTIADSILRTAPARDAPVLGHLPAGQHLILTAADDDWAAVSLADRPLGVIARGAVAALGRGHMPAGLKPGQRLRDCPRCPELVVIPPGRFAMGESADGGPVSMDLPLAFALGRFEVTHEEWRACVDAGACRPARDQGWGGGRRPANNLLWRSALDYVRWLSVFTGHRYRLPSEAEWEYAARAGLAEPRYWAEPSAACRFANLKEEGSACSDGFAGTAPVGSFAANPFGLHDMLGNVWEWVDDCWNDRLQPLPFARSRRHGQCGRRLLRGGSAGDGPETASLLFRRHEAASLSGGTFNPYFGLRVLRELE